MARDAQMSGDRVNMEYYLQFADHYFRVLADNRARQEEHQQRFQRNDEPVDGFDGGDDGYGAMDDGDDNAGEHEFQPHYNGGNRDNGRDNGRDRDGNRDQQQGRRDGNRQEEGRDRNRDRDDRNRNRDRDNGQRRERDDRGQDNRRPRGNGFGANDDRDESDEIGLPLAALPPAIGRIEDEPAAETGSAEADAPKPRRGRRPRQAEAAE